MYPTNNDDSERKTPSETVYKKTVRLNLKYGIILTIFLGLIIVM